MKRITILLTFLVTLGMYASFAQQKVSGVVTGADDGAPIPGVTVLAKGADKVGAVTNFEGKYTVEVPSGVTTLVFSFVGMVTQEVDITGKTTVNVVMKSGDVAIDDIVVTALGIKRSEKALGYSATKVTNEDLMKAGETSPMNALQGKVAGVVVTSGGGMPGASSKVIVRGYSSISGNNNPLYVVDGIPINNNVNTDVYSGLNYGNGANAINPADIESMNILKGAAATALYGSRAANGAVIITTKSGQKNQGLKIEISSNASFSSPLRIPQLQNDFGQGWSGHFAFDENGSWGPLMDGKDRLWGNVVDNSQKLKAYKAQPTNVEDFYDVGTSYFNSISLSGGNENSTFFMSYSNTLQDGIIPTDVDSYDRNTFVLSGSKTMNKLTVSGKANYIRRSGSSTPDGYGGSNSAANLYSELLQIPRDFSIVDFEDYKGDKFNNLDNFYTPYAFNPYYALKENKSEFFDDRIIGNFNVDYNFFDWLSMSARLGTDVSNFSRKDYEALMQFSPGTPNDIAATPSPGRVYEHKIHRREINFDFLVNLNRDINEDMKIDATLGYNSNERLYKDLDGGISSITIPYFYNLSNTDGERSTTTEEEKRRSVAMFGQATFSYKDYLFINASARNDWSSTLPKDNNSFFYPSFSAALSLSDMIPAVAEYADLVKLRANWGKAGNDADPYKVNSVFQQTVVWFPFYSGDVRGYQFPLQGVNAFEISDLIGNPELKPEISTEWEIGTDLRFFNQRVNLDLAYYNKITDGQILDADIAPSSGYRFQTKNFGKISNKGIEVLLSVIPVKLSNSFEWEFGLNFTKNNSKVEELAEGLDEFFIWSVYNTEFVAIKGEPLGSLKVPEIEKDAQGSIVVNESGFPNTTGKNYSYGTVQNDYQLGILNTFRFKGFEFGFAFDIRQGGYMYSGTADLNYFVGNAPQTTYNGRQPFILDNSVKPNPAYDADNPGDEPQYVENDIIIDMTNVNNPLYYPSYNLASEVDRIIPKSFVKLRELRLSYNLPQSLLAKTPIKGLAINVTGRNLLLWTPEENNFVDPETTSFGNDLRGDLGEFRTGPTLRSFTFGLNLTF